MRNPIKVRHGMLISPRRLVRELGLKTNLAACGVPRGDIPSIAARSLAEFGKDDPRFDAVVQLLEGIYSASQIRE